MKNVRVPGPAHGNGSVSMRLYRYPTSQLEGITAPAKGIVEPIKHYTVPARKLDRKRPYWVKVTPTKGSACFHAQIVIHQDGTSTVRPEFSTRVFKTIRDYAKSVILGGYTLTYYQPSL